MPFRRFSYLLIGLAAVIVASLVGVAWALRPGMPVLKTTLSVPARRLASPTQPPTTQVVVGTPEEGPPSGPPRYTYRNEFPEDRSLPRPLYLLDTQTGQETRLGNNTGAADFGVQNESYLLWYFLCSTNCQGFLQGLYAYSFATQENHLISQLGDPGIRPQIAGDWVAFGHVLSTGSPTYRVALFAANLQTREIITLTQEVGAWKSPVDGYFGISPRLAAWYGGVYPQPPVIVVYDLATHTEVARLTDFITAFNEPSMVIYDVSPGETVVTWSGKYGYDLLTQAYFRIPTLLPPNWVPQPAYGISPITEQNRTLAWRWYLSNGGQRHVSAPLIATAPTAPPCVAGQNLVQDGNLEDSAHQAVWQQSGSRSDLIVNDPPSGAPQGGQWAIRLGRYPNATHTIRQLLTVPTGVQRLDLQFAVQLGSWDRWGGDVLMVDLIDPLTNQSLLTTPVQWNDRQLASGGWLPVTVQVTGWPNVAVQVQLVFRATTDWAFPTDFTIDNIRLVTVCQ